MGQVDCVAADPEDRGLHSPLFGSFRLITQGDSIMVILLELFALGAAAWAAIGVLVQGYGQD